MKKRNYAILFFPSFLLLSTLNTGLVMAKCIPPDSSTVKQESSHSLLFSTGYGDNLVLGSSISKPQSYYYGSLAYGFKNELFLSVSSFYLPDFRELPAYSVFSLNYSHAFNSWFDISLSLSGFRTNENLADTLFSNFLYGDISAGFDWLIAYTRISASRVLTGTASNYLQVRNSRYFQTPDLFSGKMYIAFDPYVSLLFGSLTKITTTEGTSIGVSSPVWTGGGAGSGTGGGSKPGNGQGGGSGTSGTNPVTTITDYFGLMEANLGVPVSLNTGRVTIEAEPGYIWPLFTDPSIPSPKGFTLMLGIYLKIF